MTKETSLKLVSPATKTKANTEGKAKPNKGSCCPLHIQDRLISTLGDPQSQTLAATQAPWCAWGNSTPMNIWGTRNPPTEIHLLSKYRTLNGKVNRTGNPWTERKKKSKDITEKQHYGNGLLLLIYYDVKKDPKRQIQQGREWWDTSAIPASYNNEMEDRKLEEIWGGWHLQYLLGDWCRRTAMSLEASLGFAVNSNSHCLIEWDCLKKTKNGAWGDGSTVQNTCSSSRGPRFSCLYLQGGLQPFVTRIQEIQWPPMISSSKRHTHGAPTCRKNIHTCKQILNKIVF